MREDARMGTARASTGDYPEDARKRLGDAVMRAREAAGFPYRPGFANAVGRSVRSILKIESGDPVGPALYTAVGRFLPGWDEDTPIQILTGSAPPTPRPMPEPSETPDAEPVPASDLRAVAVYDLATLIAIEAPAGEYLTRLGHWRARLGEAHDMGAVAEEAQELAGDRARLLELHQAVVGAAASDTHGVHRDAAR